MVTVIQSAIGGSLAEELHDLTERVRASVVSISTGRGAGSGTIWHADGLIVTNYHVVPGERARVRFTDGREIPGTVTANLPERDLALIRVEAGELPALPVGDSTALRIGELVVAVGHPLGVPGAATLGIFSGYGPIEGGQQNGRHFREALLADIELRPGNSGGPLVTARGEVVGINAMVIGPRTALAVPSATVTRLIGGRARRVLGVRVAPINLTPALVAQNGLQQETALIVVDVAAGSIAEQAGLIVGDVLLTLDGHTIEEPGDLAWGLTEADEGAALPVGLLRAGKRIDLSISGEATAPGTV